MQSGGFVVEEEDNKVTTEKVSSLKPKSSEKSSKKENTAKLKPAKETKQKKAEEKKVVEKKAVEKKAVEKKVIDQPARQLSELRTEQEAQLDQYARYQVIPIGGTEEDAEDFIRIPIERAMEIVNAEARGPQSSSSEEVGGDSVVLRDSPRGKDDVRQ